MSRPNLCLGNLDIYLVRTALLRLVHESAPLFCGTVLDVGCGEMPYRQIICASPGVRRYIGLDLEASDIYRRHPDLVWDGASIPLPDAAVDGALSTEVLEHCPDPGAVLTEISRVLCPGGVLFCTVPFLWPLHDVPHDQYRFTPFALLRLLEGAGFHRVRLGALGGWDASLVQMLGLYVRRRAMPAWLRAFLSTCVLPLVYLVSREPVIWQECAGAVRAPFHEGAMPTGICAVAFKPAKPGGNFSWGVR